jgi:hypothetical protein
MSPLKQELPYERLIDSITEVERVARSYEHWRPYDVARVAELSFIDAMKALRAGKPDKALAVAGALVALAQVQA